jgi:hypothetical protein
MILNMCYLLATELPIWSLSSNFVYTDRQAEPKDSSSIGLFRRHYVAHKFVTHDHMPPRDRVIVRIDVTAQLSNVTQLNMVQRPSS